MYKKLEYCKHCRLSFAGLTASIRANHSRWCLKNPKSSEFRSKLSEQSKKIHTGKVVSEETKNKVKQAHKDGKYSYEDITWWIGKNHSDETKEKIRQKALSSPHRRLKRKMIEYNGEWLDSTWEFELAKRLDSIGIKWVRPEPLIWVDNIGRRHHYFPDFYLPEYDLFLDPKNPQAVKTQKTKIDILLLQYSNLKILATLEECKTFSI